MGISNRVRRYHSKDRKFLQATLRDKGFRSTEGRLRLLSLFKSADKPLSVTEVSELLRGTLNFVNVYRALEALCAKGLLVRRDLRQGGAYYEYPHSHHHHLICDDCGRTEDVKYCNAKNLKFYRYGDHAIEGDVLFATGWETAYPVFNESISIKKMYFVQDFEPLFYPMGTDYILAENTYKFGFDGVTAGGWLAQKLSKEYGMKCDYYDFGAELSLYKHENPKKRDEIFFYARPVTERRGFDLGIMALEIFHKENPQVVINLAGWDVSEYDIPFPYINHGAMDMNRLSEVYNRCAAALVLSLTNMSLLPLELLACGSIPVVNDGPNNRLVSDNTFINYVEASPRSLANKLMEIIKNPKQVEYAQKASKSVESGGWEASGAKFVKIIEGTLNT